MKILCHSCGAKYAIADEKVRGRRVKVRCKSCRTAIVVDGLAMDADAEAAEYEQHAGAGGDDDEATRVHAGAMGGEAPASDAWSVNLSDTDQRTMTTDEIIAGWQSGLVTNDAYVWREGMDDWMGVGEVPELANLIAQSVAPAPEPAAAPVAAGSSPWGASAPDASAGFGLGSAPAAARVASSRAQAHDLFGSAAAAGSEEEAIAQAQAAPGATDYGDARMTGARNENSVLFSLDALKAGFGDAGHAKPARPAPNKPTAGESANLDDLMSIGGSGPSNALFGLAQNQALLTAPPPPPPPPPPAPAFPSDPALGAAASIAPAAGGKNKMVFILGGAVVLLLLLVVGLSVAFMGGKSDDEKLAKNETGEKKSGDEKSSKSGAGSDEKKDEAKKDDGAEEKKDDTSDTKPADSAAAGGEKKEPTEEEKKRFAEAMKKKAEEEKTAPKEEAKKEEVAKKDNPSTGVASFNKGAAIAALSVAASQASGCKRPGGPTGSGKAIVTFAPSGRVTSANVTGGSFGGTPVGGCIAGVFRRANVPAFSGDPVTVSKSFTIPD